MNHSETNRKTTATKAFLAFVMACSSICPGLTPESRASIPRKKVHYDFSIARWDFSKGFHVTSIQPLSPVHMMTSADVARIIPLRELTPTSDGGRVAAQIFDRSINSLLQSELIQKSDFGKSAKTIERTLESDVSFGSSKPDSVKHNLKFAMKAAQARAQIEYSGITAAQVSYQVADDRFDIEVRENVAAISSQLIINHRKTRDENRDTVSLRWTW